MSLPILGLSAMPHRVRTERREKLMEPALQAQCTGVAPVYAHPHPLLSGQPHAGRARTPWGRLAALRRPRERGPGRSCSYLHPLAAARRQSQVVAG